MKKTIAICIMLVVSLGLKAQDTLTTLDRQAAQNYNKLKPGKSKFMLRGYFHAGWENIKSENESENNFVFGSINPILMYKQSDKLFFEAEFEGEFTSDGEFEWGMEYADMSYVLNKYITIRAGKFILPFGAFMEKLHPAWINRLATRPLGFGHDGISPSSDVGIEVRGAFYTGSVKWNYQAYVVNGAQLKDGSEEPEEAGMLKFGFLKDNNPNKSVGGRIGIMPFSNSSLELGFSGLTGTVGSKESVYEGVKANLFAVDLSWVFKLGFMSSIMDIKGQYNYSKVDDAFYLVPNDSTGATYTFNNVSDANYIQVSIKPSLLENKFFRSLEVVGRYSNLNTPKGALWERNPTQWAFGLNYWLDWRTVIKIGYETTDGIGDHESDQLITQNMFYVHWAMGF